MRLDIPLKNSDDLDEGCLSYYPSGIDENDLNSARPESPGSIPACPPCERPYHLELTDNEEVRKYILRTKCVEKIPLFLKGSTSDIFH